MIRRVNNSIRKNLEIKNRLSWYYQVMVKEKPPKFLIAKRIPFKGDLVNTDTDNLVSEHKKLSSICSTIQKNISNNTIELKTLSRESSNFIDLKVELARRMLEKCDFCEWNCRVDRLNGEKKGACKLDAKSRVSTWFHHYGEEEPLVSGRGSGTIFFTGCTFRCVFCQNWDISQKISEGAIVDARKLTLIMRELGDEGVSNINFVGGDPTPNIYTILKAIKDFDINVPLLWNSNMFLTTKSMELLQDLIDIWLPDFKWGNDRCALKLSKVPNYSKVVKRNHLIAYKNGDMIIRHLVIPGHIECCTKPILKWISEKCNRAVVNIMDQYHPDYLVPSSSRYIQINRYVKKEELRSAFDYSDKVGVLYLT
jgi:putative pyruvate formate lyase activating enzyme